MRGEDNPPPPPPTQKGRGGGGAEGGEDLGKEKDWSEGVRGKRGKSSESADMTEEKGGPGIFRALKRVPKVGKEIVPSCVCPFSRSSLEASTCGAEPDGGLEWTSSSSLRMLVLSTAWDVE